MSKIVYKKYSVYSKNLSTLFLVLFWLVLGIIVCFIGITKTYASTTTTYENIGYLNDVTLLYSLSDDPPYPVVIPRLGEYQLYNVEKIMVQIDNYTFSGGITYNLELSLPISTLTNNIYSVIDENGNKCSIGTTDSSNSSYPNYSFNCSKQTSHLTLNIYNTDGSDVLNAGIFRWNYIYLRKQLTTTDTSILENQTSQIIDQNQQIIQGQDEIKDTIKDELNSCRPSVNLFNKNSNNIYYDGRLNTTGQAFGEYGYFISEFISVVPGKTYTKNSPSADAYHRVAFYSFNGTDGFISYTNNNTFTVPEGAYYLRFSGKLDEIETTQLQEGSVSTKYEPYGEEICINKIDETNNQLGDLNNSLNNSNTSGATNDASNFFSNFTTDTFGLTSIITAPLSLINSITSSSCSILRLPLPYLENEYLELPCMNTIYTRYFGSFFNIYQTITFGIVAYWVIVRIFNQVKDFKNPDHDEIEVLDL